MIQNGAQMIGCVELRGSVYVKDKKGPYLDLDQTKKLFDSKELASGDSTAIHNATVVTGNDCQNLLFEECDILMLCAKEGIINSENVEKIKAKYIIEGANNPISYDAHKTLLERNVIIVPVFLSNH